MDYGLWIMDFEQESKPIGMMLESWFYRWMQINNTMASFYDELWRK